MNQVLEIILYTTLAGLCIPLGGLLASIERVSPAWPENELRHFIIACGGGVLVGAVALVLIPEGSEYLSYPALDVVVFIAGGLCYFEVERQMAAKQLERHQSRMQRHWAPPLGAVLGFSLCLLGTTLLQGSQ